MEHVHICIYTYTGSWRGASHRTMCSRRLYLQIYMFGTYVQVYISPICMNIYTFFWRGALLRTEFSGKRHIKPYDIYVIYSYMCIHTHTQGSEEVHQFIPSAVDCFIYIYISCICAYIFMYIYTCNMYIYQ